MEFLEKEFGEIHRQAVGGAIGKGGYPDSGNGRYIKAKGYKEWMDMST